MIAGMSEPNPTLIWETITAHHRSAALRAGVELGVFNALHNGPLTAAELGSGAGVAERAMRILRVRVVAEDRGNRLGDCVPPGAMIESSAWCWQRFHRLVSSCNA